MSDLSARLDLPLIQPSQAQKHVTHNEALQVLDGLVHAALEETGAETPPFEPVNGQLYALGANPVEDWAGQAGKLALRAAGAWLFVNPQEGWRAWDKAAGQFKVYDGAAWAQILPDLNNLDGVGVGTSSDAVNRLAVASEASLFTHDGAGHQLKVNKATAGDSASLLFQSGWTGHAEMGLAGDTAFSIKVSDDGATWHDALKADAGAQEVEIDFQVIGNAVQQSATDDTAGRLLTVGASATVLSASPALRVTYGGTANAITLTTGASLSSVPTGFAVRFRATSANTGATTINVDGTGTVAAQTITDAALPADYIRTDVDTVAVYDGTNWIVGREIERGSNANGEYVRLADGMQICTRICAVDVTSGSTQTFDWAASFAERPAASWSQRTPVPNAALENANIQGATGYASSFHFRLKAAGTSTDPTSQSEKIIASGIGRWF